MSNTIPNLKEKDKRASFLAQIATVAAGSELFAPFCYTEGCIDRLLAPVP